MLTLNSTLYLTCKRYISDLQEAKRRIKTPVNRKACLFYSPFGICISPLLVFLTDLSIKLLDLHNYLVGSKYAYVINTLLVHVIDFSYYLLLSSAASIFLPPPPSFQLCWQPGGPWHCQLAEGRHCPTLLCCCLTSSTVCSVGCHDIRRV